MNCPHCKHQLELATVFTNCRVCVPDSRLFSFFCPDCGENSEIKVEGTDVLIGGPDGFPEPGFVEEDRTAAPGISVSWREYDATIRYGGQEWTVGVTDYYREVHSPEYRADFVRRSKEAHERRHRQEAAGVARGALSATKTGKMPSWAAFFAVLIGLPLAAALLRTGFERSFSKVTALILASAALIALYALARRQFTSHFDRPTASNEEKKRDRRRLDLALALFLAAIFLMGTVMLLGIAAFPPEDLPSISRWTIQAASLFLGLFCFLIWLSLVLQCRWLLTGKKGLTFRLGKSGSGTPGNLPLARFVVPCLIVYMLGAFLWVLCSDVRQSIWFGIYCGAPILILVVSWYWMTQRRRKRR